MRSLSLRLIVPALLSVASLATPVVANASTTPVAAARESLHTAGIYRLEVTGKNRAAKVVHLVIRESVRGVEGLLLSEVSETQLSAIRFDGDIVHATVETNEGIGEIVLKVTETGVTGTLTVGGQQLMIRGERSA